MIHLFSPAKINLFLRVISKRSDGFHNLSSLFQTISLGDTLSMALGSQDELTCSDSRLATDASNLVLKAVALFKQKTSSNAHFKIHLEKHIPIQAGLGGGSSNAATALWGCNQLTNAQIPVEVLQKWSHEIGSDVPFFFSEGTAYCEGRGEIVHSLPSLPERSLWIVKPQGGLSTPEVFRRLNFSHAVSPLVVAEDRNCCKNQTSQYFNDLEKPAFEIRPELLALKMSLMKKDDDVVVMSGSGSSFFCLDKEPILSLKEGFSLFPAHYINRQSPQWYLPYEL